MEKEKRIEVEAEIGEILVKLEIPSELRVKEFLKTIISSAVIEPDSFDLGELYIKLGRENNITSERVRLSICHAIGNYWNRNSLVILSDHFGHAVTFRERHKGEPPNGAGKPTNLAFIEMLAANLRLKYKTQQDTKS